MTMNRYKTLPIQAILWFVLLSTVASGLKAQEQLTLQQCRQMALKNNKKIAIARENRNAVGSLEKSAKTLFFPKIQFNGGYFRMNKQLSLFSKNMFLPVVPSEVYQNGLSSLDPQSNPELVRETFVTQDFNGVPVPMEDPKTGDPLFDRYALLPKDEAKLDLQNIFFGSVGVTQPIYMGGKIRHTYDMAQHGEQMMEARTKISEAEVLLETDKSYWKVISLKEKVKLAGDYLKRIDTLLTDVKNLHQEGIITNNKVMRVKVKKNQIELELMKAKNGLQLARMALNQNIGLPLDTVVHLADSLGDVTRLSDPHNYRNQALESRPELNALEQGVEIARSGKKLMQSRYLPNIGLTANYVMSNPNPWNGFESEFGGDITLGVALNIPIYNWGERKHTLQAVEHKKRASQKKLEQSRELISLEVKKTIFSYNEAVKKVEMTRSSLQQAKENLEMTRDNFEEGMVKSADVLEAQSMWQEAYSEYIDAATDYRIQQAKLLKASGRLLDEVKTIK
jgi:outer membrane protein TolC